MTKKDFIQKWIGWVSYSEREKLTKEMETDLESVSQALRIHDVIGWVALAESHPKPESELIMYREDAGVFFGYYGSLEESLPEDQKENLYEQGLTEEDMFENRFYYYDMAGNGLLELDTLPQFWAEASRATLPITPTALRSVGR